MQFKIEFSDEHFRLIIVSASGQEDFLDALPYCSVSSVVGDDGVVYGCYLSGSERELDELSSHPTNVELAAQTVKVYDLTAWPTLRPISGSVTLIETEFDDVEDIDPAYPEDQVIDVEPA